jgi:hypothetical protein
MLLRHRVAGPSRTDQSHAHNADCECARRPRECAPRRRRLGYLGDLQAAAAGRCKIRCSRRRALRRRLAADRVDDNLQGIDRMD